MPERAFLVFPPFALKVTGFSLFISFLALHFTQYAVVMVYKYEDLLNFRDRPLIGYLKCYSLVYSSILF